MIFAFWGGALGFVLGGFVGAGALGANNVTRDLAAGSGVSIFGVVGSAIVSAGVGFAFVWAVILIHDPLGTILSVVGGAVLAFVIVGGIARYEGDLLTLRGYRRPSRDEARILAPAVQSVGTAMRLDSYPRFCIWDSALQGAWTHMRHIVLSTALLDVLEPDELQAVLAHELHHWRRGDSVSLRIVWAAGLPISLLYNLGCVLSGRNKPDANVTVQIPSAYRDIAGLFGWFLLWPTWVVMKLIIGPLTASHGRQCEYEADAAAADVGLSQPLVTALRQITQFEPGRSGWEQVLMASHPATELRIEALQAKRPDDDDFQEGPLGRVLAS